MKVVVTGGDGFCGWPSSLHLSARGHQVVIVDNLARRRMDEELGTRSLTPILSIQDRIRTWHDVTGNRIGFHDVDVAKDYDGLAAVLAEAQPDAIIHFAEQRAAPYSMRSPAHKRYTVDNNISATHNLLCGITEICPKAHLIHLGSMGVYGYGCLGSLPVPEGYVPATLYVDGHEVRTEISFPADPGSIYHTTKVLDHYLFQFYAKNNSLQVTDLHQGIVWGTQTEETRLHPGLINRFDYDGDFGTILNRFLVQATVGHPLTVYGTGGQTRAFIHIRDTVRCIELALLSPPTSNGKVRVFNQLTEVHRVRDLAEMVAKLTGAEIRYLENPRKEKLDNELSACNNNLKNLGIRPTLLSERLIEDVMELSRCFSDRCDPDRIMPKVKW